MNIAGPEDVLKFWGPLGELSVRVEVNRPC